MSEAVSILLIDDNPEEVRIVLTGASDRRLRGWHVSKDDRLVQVVESSDADVVVFHLNPDVRLSGRLRKHLIAGPEQADVVRARSRLAAAA